MRGLRRCLGSTRGRSSSHSSTDHTQITLIDPGRVLEDLMPIALSNRPEVAACPRFRRGG